MADKIRVLHICDKFGVQGSSIHGVGRLFSWWMPRFDAERFEVSLVGLRDADESVANLRERGIELTALGRGRFDLGTVFALERLMRERRAQIVHMHGYGATNFGGVAALRSGAKRVVHEHFVDPANPGYQKPFDWCLARTAHVGLANCEAVKDFMVEQRLMRRERIRVVWNGAPLAEFRPPPREAVARERERWGIEESDTVVASIGRLDEQKGNRYFLDAVAMLFERAPRFKVVVAGDGPLQGELEAQCARLGIADDVIFMGYHSDVPLLQSLIDVQVIPSLWEGTTLTVFEAMSMELPIVATDVDGLGEVLTHDENALLVPPADPAALADALSEVLEEPDRRKRLAAQARVDSARFDIQRTVEELQDLYTELAG